MKISRLFCAAVLGCIACGASAAPDDSPLSEQRQGFTATPDAPNHEEIVAAALSFLRPDVLTALEASDASVDVEFALINAYHFDDCNFSGGSEAVQSEQAAAVEALDPNDATVDTDGLAILHFGRSLHTIQDFYSHSNWVELGAQTIVDTSLGPFPRLSGYVAVQPSGWEIVQGRPPRGVAVWRDRDAPYPKNAVVHVRDARVTTYGIMSGTVDYEPGNDCPNAIAMTHADLNKDQSGLPNRGETFLAAKSLATQQTTHEWCRLVALTQARWGDGGVARLMTWVADPSALPTCQ